MGMLILWLVRLFTYSVLIIKPLTNIRYSFKKDNYPM